MSIFRISKRRVSSAYFGCCALLLGRNLRNSVNGSSSILYAQDSKFFFCEALIPSSTHRLSNRNQSPRPSSARKIITMSSSHPNTNLVSIREAINAHSTPSNRAIFIDGSWHMPVGPSPRNGRSEFMSGPRIPGAFYFDIDDVSLPSSSNPKNLPHMKPPQKVFSLAMDQMGITPDDTLYVYASEGCGFVHRAYWTLRSCGHNPKKIRLVQGSFKEWKECEGKLEYEELTEGDGRLFRMKDVDIENATPKYKCWNKDEGNDSKEEKNVVTMSEVLDVVKQSKMGEGGIIVDARSAGRFVGTEPEPRPGLRGGHMPGALNVPFVSLLDSNDKTKFKPMAEVKEIFVKAGVKELKEDGDETVSRKVICSCGSGVTAAALAIALEECGLRKKEDICIYDGSWIEWGGDEETPIIK